MLDQIELVFNRLKECHLEIKPKKYHFFDTSVLFFGPYSIIWRNICKPQKVEKVQDWPIPMTVKEVHSFLGLASYYWRFIAKFAWIAQC